MTRLRTASLVTPLLAAALFAAGCGEEAKSTTASTRSGPATTTAATPPNVTTDETADMQGWTDASWQLLGGRPDTWPADVTPPLSTTRATLHVEDDGVGDDGVTILSGNTPLDTDTLETQLEEQFASWKAVEGTGVTDEKGVWERDGLHVTITVREDGERSSYGYIIREA